MAGEFAAQTVSGVPIAGPGLAATARKVGAVESSKGFLFALAFVLIWLGAVCLYIAFEGQSILGETVPASGGGGASYFKAAVSGLRNKVQGNPVRQGPASSAGTSGG